eukprot:jgi/Bigna1/66090/fgenesh1_pg.1_\
MSPCKSSFLNVLGILLSLNSERFFRSPMLRDFDHGMGNGGSRGFGVVGGDMDINFRGEKIEFDEPIEYRSGLFSGTPSSSSLRRPKENDGDTSGNFLGHHGVPIFRGNSKSTIIRQRSADRHGDGAMEVISSLRHEESTIEVQHPHRLPPDDSSHLPREKKKKKKIKKKEHKERQRKRKHHRTSKQHKKATERKKKKKKHKRKRKHKRTRKRDYSDSSSTSSSSSSYSTSYSSSSCSSMHSASSPPPPPPPPLPSSSPHLENIYSKNGNFVDDATPAAADDGDNVEAPIDASLVPPGSNLSSAGVRSPGGIRMERLFEKRGKIGRKGKHTEVRQDDDDNDENERGHVSSRPMTGWNGPRDISPPRIRPLVRRKRRPAAAAADGFHSSSSSSSSSAPTPAPTIDMSLYGSKTFEEFEALEKRMERSSHSYRVERQGGEGTDNIVNDPFTKFFGKIINHTVESMAHQDEAGGGGGGGGGRLNEDAEGGGKAKRKKISHSRVIQMNEAERAEEVHRVLSIKDDAFKILNVWEDDSEDYVRKSYRYISLILHPDKCSHPGASEAMRRVQTSLETLMDDAKREVIAKKRLVEYTQEKITDSEAFIERMRRAGVHDPQVHRIIRESASAEVFLEEEEERSKKKKAEIERRVVIVVTLVLRKRTNPTKHHHHDLTLPLFSSPITSHKAARVPFLDHSNEQDSGAAAFARARLDEMYESGRGKSRVGGDLRFAKSTYFIRDMMMESLLNPEIGEEELTRKYNITNAPSNGADDEIDKMADKFVNSRYFQNRNKKRGNDRGRR